MGVIRIGDLPLEVRIGTLPEERVSSQTVLVDLEIQTDLSAAAASDHLDDTVNYIDVVDVVRRVTAGVSCFLVETLARRIVDAVVGVPGVTGARVRVRKSHLPGLGGARFVEIEEERRSV